MPLKHVVEIKNHNYPITEDENGAPTTGMGELIIAKHRNGPVDSVKVRYIGQYTKFADLDVLDTNVDYGSGSSSAGMMPNEEFGQNTFIQQSKKWDVEEDPF